MSRTSKPKITGDHFYKFFQCPHWIWRDLYEDQQKRKEIPPLLDMVFRDGLRHKEKTISRKEFEQIPKEMHEDLDEAFLATLNLMREGKNIYRGVLMDKRWVGMPDLLEKRPGKSNLGGFYYVPYDIRNIYAVRDEHRFPLVFYSLILEKIQGVLPEYAYIIDGDGNEREIGIKKFLDKFHLALEQIEKMLDGERPAPFLKGGCKKTPWFSLCYDEVNTCDDVSLVHGIKQLDQRVLYDSGIKTVDDLANANSEELYKNIETWDYDKITDLQRQARLLKEDKLLVIKKPEFPKSETELYFDVESDPTQNLNYLLGVLVHEKGKTQYYSFFAKDINDEERMWHDFLQFIDGFNEFTLYHYSYYEIHVLNRLQRLYKTPEQIIIKIKDRSIDIYQVTQDSIVLPTYFYGLKDVAGYIGYKWSQEGIGGAESVLLFDEWQKTKSKKLKTQLLIYNEDDVRATKAVKEWLETIKPEKPKTE